MYSFITVLLIGSALHSMGVASFDEILEQDASVLLANGRGVGLLKAKEPTPFTSMQIDLVNILNRGRRDVTPAASDMMKVRWDDALEKAAANIVDTCFFSVSMPVNINIDKRVLQATGITKNTSFYLPDAFTEWLELGQASYIYKDFSCQSEESMLCKIYKLLTWSAMHKVGCSQRFCPVLYDSFSSKTEKNYVYWKCNYAKIGSFWEDRFSYSSDGEPCTECFHGSGWCDAGLCDDSCTTDNNNCGCAIDSNCSSNGVFLPEKCACNCKEGYSGNSCQLTDSDRSSTDAPQSVVSPPLYCSTTDAGSLVLGTSPVMSTHSTVVSNFLTGNKAVAKRDVPDPFEPYTMEETTFVDFTTLEPIGSTADDVTEKATSIEYSTEELTTEELEEFTSETVTSEEVTDDSTFEDLTTEDWSTESLSTDYPAEETTEEAISPIGYDATEELTTEERSATTGEPATPCSRICQGEGRLDNSTCTCTCDQEGYTYNYTQSACLVCGLESPCNDQGVLHVDTCTCHCASGYRGDQCEEICNVNATSCWEDYVPPETLLADFQFYCPVYCPDCGSCPDDMSCSHGGYVEKVMGFEEVADMCRCYCPLPWSGLECDECNLECANGGTLNSTECSCQCLQGSSGVDCSETCIQKSMLCTQNAFHHCDMPVIAKNCPDLCGFCEGEAIP